jgi:hypothetical protein
MSERTPRMSEESRLQIAVVAGATERSNRPRFLLAVAGLLLAVAVIYTAVQAQALGSARAQIRSQEQTAQRISALVAEVRSAHRQSQLVALPRDAATTDKLQRLGKSLGLPSSLSVGERGQGAGAPGFTKRVYTTNFVVQDVGRVLDWLVQATGENSFGITGVELSSLKLRPQHSNPNGGWTVEVVFSRIEMGS